MNTLPNIRRAPARPKRDLLFWTTLGSATLLLVGALIPLTLAMRMSARHHAFVQDLSISLIYARRHGSLAATRDGKPVEVSTDEASRLYGVLAGIGMGRPRGDEPLGEGVAGRICLTFGDGSSLSLWPVTITERGRSADEGVAVRYVGTDGRVFCYDTDQARLDDLVGGW